MLEAIQFPALTYGAGTRRVLTGAAVVAVGVSIASPVAAQTTEASPPSEASQSVAEEPQDGRLSDIVVTAQRRTERLQDVPIAVTAIASDAMQVAGIDKIADLPKLAPSLTCRSACKKDPLSGVIGVQKGPLISMV